MGRIQEYQVPVHHYRKSRTPCMQRTSRKQTSHKLIWVPKIPSWEKDFCYKIGLFTWDKFLEAKNLTQHFHKVLQWDDLAAEEAFHNAKNSFFAQINGLPNPNHFRIPNRDMYIDEIDWDNDDDKVIYPDLSGSVSSEEEEDDEYDHVGDYRYDIRIEDIKPTGWDVHDVEEFSAGKVLTGLVIGE